MERATNLDPAALRRYGDELRTSTGWLLQKCAAPCSTAMQAAMAAVAWPDAAPHFFATRWDQEVDSLARSLAVYVGGLEDVINAYYGTDAGLH